MQRSSAEDESWSRDDMQNCWSWMAPTRGSGRPAMFHGCLITWCWQRNNNCGKLCRNVDSVFFLMVYFLWFISPLTWLDVADPCGSQNLQHDSIKFNQWHAHFFEAAQPSTSQGRCSFPPSWDLRIWTETRSFSLKKLGVPYVSDLSDVKLPGCTKYSTGPVVQLILLIFLLFWGDGNHHIVAHIGIVISCYIIGG